jgi:RNA polymerase-binding protein DksA
MAKKTASGKSKAAKKPATKKAAPKAKKAPAKKAPAKKPAAKKAAPKAKKPAAKKAAKKPAAKKPAAKKPATKAKTTTKKAPVKKTTKAPAKKAAKPAAKKSPAKKAAPKKAAPAKTAAKATSKKAPAKAPAKVVVKPAAAAKSPNKKVSFERSATNIPNKGVLIRLKRTGKNYDSAGREKLRTVAAVEKSPGIEPINLHHRKPNAKELEKFRELLIERRSQLTGVVKDLEAQAFSEDIGHVSTNHLADSSTDQYNQDFALSMMENETEELKEIGRALEKIDIGTYGECEACGIDISLERLAAMPYTRICIHCRTKFEEEGGGEEFGVLPETRI